MLKKKEAEDKNKQTKQNKTNQMEKKFSLFCEMFILKQIASVSIIYLEQDCD